MRFLEAGDKTAANNFSKWITTYIQHILHSRAASCHGGVSEERHCWAAQTQPSLPTVWVILLDSKCGKTIPWCQSCAGLIADICQQYARGVAGTSRTEWVALPEQTLNNWAHQSSAWETSGDFFPLKIASAGSIVYSVYILYIVYSNTPSLTWPGHWVSPQHETLLSKQKATA